MEFVGGPLDNGTSGSDTSMTWNATAERLMVTSRVAMRSAVEVLMIRNEFL